MTVHPASVPRQFTFSICRVRFWKLTVLSPFTVLELEREDQIQITTPAGDKSAACLGCRNLKASIELGHMLLAQKTVRFLHAAHAA